MSPELEKKLFDKYPLIFSGHDKNPRESLICFGLECGDGWYDIIDVLCNEIQEQVDYKNSPQVVAVQVKEKFGSLRFYTGPCDDIVYSLISMASDLSCRTCETCGDKGKLYTNGWWYVACDKHTKPEDKDEQETENN